MNLPKLKIDSEKFKPKSYGNIRVWGDTRDLFKKIAERFNVPMTEFLHEVALQLYDQFMVKENENVEPTVPKAEGPKDEAVENTETIRPHISGPGSQSVKKEPDSS